MFRLAASIPVVLLFAAQAQAWSDAGHKIIASIAWRQLDAGQRTRIVELLKGHPRYEQDFVRAMPGEVRSASDDLQHEWLIQQAAIWPDLARGFPEAEKERFHHSTWHYINQPLFLTNADETALRGKLRVNLRAEPREDPVESLNVVQAIRLGRRVAADSGAGREERALMLSWLAHTVGNLHQPLHSTALFAEGLFPEGDRGGNLIRTGQRSNLHSVWDGLPGGRVKVTEARNRGLELLQLASLRMMGEQAVGSLSESEWVVESHELCREVVYAPEVLAHLRSLPRNGGAGIPALTLSDDYLKTAARAAEHRLVAAGYRLGAVLKDVADAN